MASNKDLIERATAVAKSRRVSSCVEVGQVGSALLTEKGAVYTGICVIAHCGLGFCAEQAAIGTMLTRGEDRIVCIVAVDWNGRILSPCGRCRELVLQVSGDGETNVITAEDRVVKIKELMPNHWYENSSQALEDQIN